MYTPSIHNNLQQATTNKKIKKVLNIDIEEYQQQQKYCQLSSERKIKRKKGF